MTPEQRKGCEEIIKAHSVEEQELQAIKECNELMEAIFKFQDKKAGLDKVVDELADVLIMCNQLMIIHQCKDAVEQRIDYKIARQIGRDKESEESG